MKDLFKNGLIVLLIIAALYIIFLRECKKPIEAPCPPVNKVLVDKTVWDSVCALSNKPAIVTRETIRIVNDPVHVPTSPSNPLPKPNTTNADSTRTYIDSLVKKDINVHYNFKVKGILLDRSWDYTPVITRIKVDSLVYVPKIVDRPFPVVKNGLFVYGTVGGNKTAFIFGGGGDWITKKETLIGYEYQRYGNIGFHSVKLGGKIKIGK
jgi:hypothetical protein